MRDIIKRPKVNLGHLVLINKTLKMRNTNIFCSDLSTPMTRSIYQGGKLLARFLTTRAERAPLTLISLLCVYSLSRRVFIKVCMSFSLHYLLSVFIPCTHCRFLWNKTKFYWIFFFGYLLVEIVTLAANC